MAGSVAVLMAIDAAAYTFGRIFTEYERIDSAHRLGPQRINDWVSLIVFVGAVAVLIQANFGGKPQGRTGGRSGRCPTFT